MVKRLLKNIVKKIVGSMNNVYVLMFHNVSDKKINYSKSCIINIDNFNKLLDVATQKSKILSIDELYHNLEIRKFIKGVCITFDDGCDNTYEIASKILIKRRIPFVIFVVLDYLDQPSYMTKEQMIEINSSSLCTIGAHTLSHPTLASLTQMEQELEIIQSKNKLEEILGEEINYFAYPYGGKTAVSKLNRETVKKTGYKLAFSTIGYGLNRVIPFNKYYLYRITACNDTVESIIKLLLA